MSEFAKTLKKGRQRVGLDQIPLARDSEISQQMVSAIERGSKEPSLDVAERLARTLISAALPTGFKVKEVTREERPDGRYRYLLTVRKGIALYNLPIDGLEPLATKALWKGRAHQLEVLTDFIEATLKALLDGEIGDHLRQAALPVPAQIAQAILKRGPP